MNYNDAAFEAANSMRFVSLEEEDFKDGCAFYLSYRVVQGFKQAVKETVNRDVSWEDCNEKMRCEPVLKCAAEQVLRMAIMDFQHHGKPDFSAIDERASWPLDEEHSDEDAMLHLVTFCPIDMMCSYVDLLLYFLEVKHYEYLRKEGRKIKWEQYLDELLAKGEAWDVLNEKFKIILARLDFVSLWKSHEFDEWAQFV